MIHREGTPTILIATAFSLALCATAFHFLKELFLIQIFIYAFCAALMIIVLQFFRNPGRNTIINNAHVLSPADGKVVVIEEVEEPEYFKGKRKQISVFMSPFNVHVNRNPIAGEVVYAKYHPGLYLVAWHPKSSTENERTSVVIKHQSGKEVLFRQIAGALARRIVYYVKEKQTVEQGGEMGFIKFGSRVDVYIPLDSKVEVALNQVVRGGETVLASW